MAFEVDDAVTVRSVTSNIVLRCTRKSLAKDNIGRRAYRMKGKNNRLTDFKWCLKMAWEMNPWALLGWMGANTLIALLPFVSLTCQRELLNRLSMYIATGNGQIADCLFLLSMLGVTLILLGISKRINGDFLFEAIYDYYYVGLADRFADVVQRVELKTLRCKGIKDEYRFVRYQFSRLCGLMTRLLGLVRALVTILSLLVLAGQYSVVILAATLVYLMAVILISGRFNVSELYDYVKQRGYESRTKYYESSAMDPNIAKELRIFHNADQMVEEWEEAYQPIFVRDIKIARRETVLTMLCSVSYYLLMMALLGYSIFQIRDGWMNVSAFLVLYGMAENMSSSIAEAIRMSQSFLKELRNLGRMRAFMETTPLMEQRPGEEPERESGDVVFEARDVSFSYDDEHEVLKHVSFQIRRGETVALVGLNGSGKSTMINLLTELYHPTGGELRFCGVPYDAYPRGSINDNIGIFFQDYRIFHNTLAHNVGFGDLKHIDQEERILQAMEKGGALKLLEKLPKGIHTWLVRKVKKGSVNLSGGEQQKVAMSRAHMSDREVLIFDEPASALDPVSEMRQFQVIQEKLQGRTGILISHRVGFARMADRILVLQDGCLIENGTHGELLEKGGVYADFFRTQAEWYDTADCNRKGVSAEAQKGGQYA